jgi:hypothetical protein
MGLILYLPGKNEASATLLRIIKTAIPDHEIEIYSSINELSERLHQSMLDVGVAVLHVASRAELMEIIYLGVLLKELKIVLVLPDNQPDTLDKAYTLCPRFIVAAESDFKHLGSVLKRMVDLYDKTH